MSCEKSISPHIRYLRHYAHKNYQTLSVEEREDLVQETLLKAVLHWSQYDAKQGRVITWLTTILKRCAIDLFRRANSPKRIPRPALSSLDSEVRSDSDGVMTLHEVVKAPLNSSFDPSIEEDCERVIRSAVAGLDEKHAQVILLRYRDGLCYRDIAKRTQIPIGTVKIWLHRIRPVIVQHIKRLAA